MDPILNHCVLIRKGGDTRVTDTHQGEECVRTEAETGVMQLRAKEPKDFGRPSEAGSETGDVLFTDSL